jgi:uncharacterized RDD family membrane protein YckC
MIASGEPTREVVTPEGVPLRFSLASAGERVGAFLVDVTLLVAAAIGVVLLAVLATVAARGIGAAIGLVAFFFLRSFYFTWFECRAAGATPGKRLLGLRVVDAHGGMLAPEAVFARNFMREIELFAPLAFALAPDELLPDRSTAARLAAGAWLALLALLPLFNRDRLRAGDLVAGTLVVRSPRAVLLDDLSAAPTRGRTGPAACTFSPAELDLYGIHELQVLESLLRQRGARPEALEAVARKIQRKIGWSGAPEALDARAFLHAFYTAQRARLEERMLLGDRRESKRPRAPTRRP